MALNISSLQEYIQLHPELLVTYMYEDLTLRRARVYDVSGITAGKFSARIYEPVAHLGPCCRIPNGTSNVIERLSEAVCILDGQDYCETDLSQVLRDAAQVFTAGGERAGSIEQVIIDGQVAAFVEALDVLTFQGDKSLTDDNLNRVDGLIKIAENDGAVQVNLTSGTAFQGLNEAIRALPRNARKMGGIVVFCPEEFAETYYEVAMALNLYHYSPGMFRYGDERPVIGKDGIRIIPTRGMNGTNKLLVTPARNVIWFSSKEDDHNTLSWKYTEYHQLYYWRIKTIFGVQLAIPEWSVIAEYDPAILDNGISTNVNIISPLSASGNLAVDSTITSPIGQGGGVLTTDTPVTRMAFAANVADADVDAEIRAFVNTEESAEAEEKPQKVSKRGKKPQKVEVSEESAEAEGSGQDILNVIDEINN